MIDTLVLIGLELGVSAKLLHDIHENNCRDRNRCRFIAVALLTAHAILKMKGLIYA